MHPEPKQNVFGASCVVRLAATGSRVTSLTDAEKSRRPKGHHLVLASASVMAVPFILRPGGELSAGMALTGLFGTPKDEPLGFVDIGDGDGILAGELVQPSIRCFE